MKKKGHEHGEVDLISIQAALAGTYYPANKEELIEVAEKNYADQDILTVLSELPNVRFTSPTQLNETLAKQES